MHKSDWPEWALMSTDQELWDVIGQFDHNIRPEVGVRGFLCTHDACGHQVQHYDGGWWHVREIIAYGVLEGRPYTQALDEAEKNDAEPQQRTLALIAASGNTDDKGEELTQQERVDQTLAMWEGWE